jgi:glycosyltransferase involved in cell wall biosynthesis
MAAGLPVVATDVGAIGEAVCHGETGLLVPPHDVTALGAALDTLVRDINLRQSMGLRARVVAELRFDCRVNARRILSLLAGITGN